jgi:hypothetical protein
MEDKDMGEAKRRKAAARGRTWATGVIEVIANGVDCFMWSGTRRQAIKLQRRYLDAVNLLPIGAHSYAKRAAGYLMAYGMPKAGDPDLRPSNHGARWDQLDIDFYKVAVLWLALREHVPSAGAGVKLEDVFVGIVLVVSFKGDKDLLLADTAHELSGHSLEGRGDVGHVEPGTPMAKDQFEMMVGVIDGHHRLNPRDAVSMTNGELFALAGKPLPADEAFAGELIYLPRIPLDAAEAAAMTAMMTVFADTTRPNEIRTYAGYTNEELCGGKPHVLVR